MLVLSLFSLHSSPLDLLFWDPLKFFLFSHHLSHFLTPHTVALLVLFAWAVCPISSTCSLSESEFWLEKCWKLGTSSILNKISKRQTFTAELQGEQVQTHPQKFAPTLALKWYPQDLIGRAKLFDIPAASHHQGGKCIFSPHICRLAAAKRRVLQRAVCHLAGRIDNNTYCSDHAMLNGACLPKWHFRPPSQIYFQTWAGTKII